jgi:hypothetical protein
MTPQLPREIYQLMSFLGVLDFGVAGRMDAPADECTKVLVGERVLAMRRMREQRVEHFCRTGPHLKRAKPDSWTFSSRAKMERSLRS